MHEPQCRFLFCFVLFSSSLTILPFLRGMEPFAWCGILLRAGAGFSSSRAVGESTKDKEVLVAPGDGVDNMLSEVVRRS